MGGEFDPLTGEPTEWHVPEPAVVTWYEEATAYTVMKWPSLAAHSRASVAEALATVTPALTQPGGRGRPGPRELRTALYQHAFNPARPAEPGSAAARILDWALQASLPVGCLSDPAVLRTALEALTFRLDGSRAAANTIIRKRVVLHGALGYAAESGLLPDNPLDSTNWRVPKSSAALDPAVVASPDQVSMLLDAVARTRPELIAFFGCLYYAALRPEEAVALRTSDCHLPTSGWGMLRLASAAPRTAAAWTSDGTSYERRGLKHRPEGTIRMVPAPPVLVAVLRAHHAAYGTAPDGRLFRGTRGGPLSGSVYGRAWQSARALALGPELAAGGLARRPYDLRHAALSLWLNSGGDPPRSRPGPGTASRSCSPSTATASTATTTSSTSRSAASSGRPHHLVRARPWKASGCTRPRNSTEASGYTDRATGTQAVRYASVDFPPGPPTARRPTSAPSGRTPKKYC